MSESSDFNGKILSIPADKNAYRHPDYIIIFYRDKECISYAMVMFVNIWIEGLRKYTTLKIMTGFHHA
jgi:hypothetical protein